MTWLRTPTEVGSLTFDEVYRRYAGPVYRFCLSQVRNPAEAEDVAAEVFISALAAYDRARPGEDELQAWLLRIARNEIIDRARTRKRRSNLLARFFSVRSEIDPHTDVEGQVLLRAELRHTIGAMKQLSARDRLLVGLRLAADLPYAEIGSVLGISEHTATVATRRAIQRLRTMLAAAAS